MVKKKSISRVRFSEIVDRLFSEKEVNPQDLSEAVILAADNYGELLPEETPTERCTNLLRAYTENIVRRYGSLAEITAYRVIWGETQKLRENNPTSYAVWDEVLAPIRERLFSGIKPARLYYQ
ncbi:MAG: hypothetical protein AABX04_01890 [Nanoarchaeota archaeon]